MHRHFVPVIAKAKDACNNSGHAVSDHFEDALEMVDIGSGAKRNIDHNSWDTIRNIIKLCALELRARSI